MEFDTLIKKNNELGVVGVVEVGFVRVEGLPGATLLESIVFEDGSVGSVFGLNEKYVDVVLYGKPTLKPGMRAARSGNKVQIMTSEKVLGKMVSPLGRVLMGDTNGAGEGVETEIEQMPLGIMDRVPISEQLVSGIPLVDLLIPIGKGQRELIIGDRKTGKSRLLWQILISQAKRGALGIYAGIGRKKSELLQAVKIFEEAGVMRNCLVVGSSSSDSSGEIFLTPYTALSYAEYFRNMGRDVVVVLDDMTTHAKFYREISLLSKNFPGRDSYPGDIFFAHSRLVERGGRFGANKGSGKEASITLFPIAESVQGDITGYIQTNLMSMTDGHIFFDTDLFFKGRRPAIHPFLSVTRVGRQTQSKLTREISQHMIDMLSLHEKTQSFQRFGAELSETSRQILAIGDKLYGFFDLPMGVFVPLCLQMVCVVAIINGLWSGGDIAKLVEKYEKDEEMKKVVDEMAGVSKTYDEYLVKVRLGAQKIFKI